MKIKFKQTLSGITFALFATITTMNGSAIASTPDGVTPANEGVCDALQGLTAGLYGLCVAYCEAQDLDSIDKRPPSLRILANYQGKMQAGDPDMPCSSPNYTCFNENELNSIVTTNTCTRFSDATGSVIQYGVQDGVNSHFVKVDTRPEASCVYVDILSEPDVIRNQLFTDATKAQEAFDAAETKCSSLGL